MLNLIDMCKNINQILGYDQRECGKQFYPETGTFDDWHKANNLKVKDGDGNHKNSSQIYFCWYQSDIASGKWKDTPYCDFWHWMLDNCFDANFRNDTEQHLYLGNLRITFHHKWQKEIYKVWQSVYGHLCDEHGYIEVHVSW